MGKSRWRVGALGLTVMSAAAACDAYDARAPVSATELNSAEYTAARSIAAARCDRQKAGCQTFASRDACIREKILPSAADARLKRCYDAIDQDQLERCIDEIRERPCGSGIVGLPECRRASLCPDVPEEGTI